MAFILQELSAAIQDSSQTFQDMTAMLQEVFAVLQDVRPEAPGRREASLTQYFPPRAMICAVIPIGLPTRKSSDGSSCAILLLGSTRPSRAPEPHLIACAGCCAHLCSRVSRQTTAAAATVSRSRDSGARIGSGDRKQRCEVSSWNAGFPDCHGGGSDGTGCATRVLELARVIERNGAGRLRQVELGCSLANEARVFRREARRA